MKKVGSLVCFMLMLVSQYSLSWEAKVVELLQHEGYVAVYLSPDPGIGNCEYGQPYLLPVDGTPAKNQRFSLMLTALTAGLTIRGHADECSSAIWGKSRPTIRRVSIIAN